jgi:hypothetical protein
VERSVAEQALAADERVAPNVVEEIRHVGDRTFLLREGVWVDTAFDSERDKAEEIAFGGARYFQLLRQHPELGAYLALGDQVIVVFDGAAYAIGEFPERPALTPTRPVTPTPTPAR